MEGKILEHLRSRLINMGYPTSSLRTGIQTSYGNRIDLVVYESGKPKIVFELKAGTRPVSQIRDAELGFHPAVRQAQLLAQGIGAPYFAVYDGVSMLWFDVDKEQGRPRLLEGPVLPLTPQFGEERIRDGRDTGLRLLFALSDVERGYLGLQEGMAHIGMALLARLWSEAGDKSLEDLLLMAPSQEQLADVGLPDWGVSFDERSIGFYPEAFSVLDGLELTTLPPSGFDDALNEFIQINVGRSKYGVFKLPGWITELLVSLAQISPGDTVLDMYSNFGDGMAAIAKHTGQVKASSLASNPTSYIWDKLRRMVLGLNPDDVTRLDFVDECTQEDRFAGRSDHIIVAPPFGIRLKRNGILHRSEDLYLTTALDWVKPGGRVVAIVPESLLVSSRRAHTRDYVYEHAWIRTIISLEQSMPGTSVKASIMVLDREAPDTLEGRVMMGRIQRQDAHSLLHPDTAVPANDRIQRMLEVYRAHMKNEAVPDEQGIWFVQTDDLDSRSWAVDFYDPARMTAISSGYPTASLQELAEMRRGSYLTLDEQGSLLVIGPGAVRTLSIDPTRLDRTTEERLTSNPVIAHGDDVLIHTVGSYRGQAAVVGSDFEGLFVSRNLIVLRPSTTLILSSYLAIALNSRFAQDQLRDRETGSVVRYLSIRKLRDLRIPVPEIPTQKLIVERVTEAQHKLVEIEQQALVIQSAREEQQRNLQSILDKIHLGGGEEDA